MIKLLKRFGLATALAGLLAAVWFVFAPPSIGGQTSYVIIRGTSMAPRFHSGDLVLLRHTASTRVGDVAAYRSTLLRRVVMHRIVAIHDGRLTFKGDNTGFLDEEQPTSAAVVGRLWLRIPRAGAVYAWLFQPSHAPVVGALVALLLLGGGARATVRRRRVRNETSVITEVPVLTPERSARGVVARGKVFSAVGGRRVDVAGAAAVALGVVTVAAALVALFVFSRPDSTLAGRAAAYSQLGSFSYSAHVPRSTVYPTGRVKVSDPIFLRLVRDAKVTFGYSFASKLLHRVHGSAGMSATLQSPQGWTRHIALAPVRPFRSDAVSISGTLHLDHITALVAGFQRATGVAQSTYTLTVTPTIAVRGVVGGERVDTHFSPTLPLGIDAYEIRVAPPQTLGTEAAPNPLSPSEPGAVLAQQPAHVGIGALSVGVHALRVVSVGIAFVAGMLALLASLLYLRGLRRLRKNESARIDHDYSELIVPVTRALIRRGARMVDVATMDSLVQIADRHDRMILHEELDGRHAYLVEDGGVVYRYRVGEPVVHENGNGNGNGEAPATADGGERRSA